MSFNGDAVSLHPSVGNWNLRCRSHYVIRDGRVIEGAEVDERRYRSRKTSRRGCACQLLRRADEPCPDRDRGAGSGIARARSLASAQALA
jgi:hypothetical protein